MAMTVHYMDLNDLVQELEVLVITMSAYNLIQKVMMV
jgi:hypothetical protein